MTEQKYGYLTETPTYARLAATEVQRVLKFQNIKNNVTWTCNKR